MNVGFSKLSNTIEQEKVGFCLRLELLVNNDKKYTLRAWSKLIITLVLKVKNENECHQPWSLAMDML